MTRFHKASPDLRKVSPTVGLPPPLRGRVGERGKPQALTYMEAS
jgi:hypothetical protein